MDHTTASKHPDKIQHAIEKMKKRIIRKLYYAITLNDSVKKAIRTDCLRFLVELCFQIKQQINLSEVKLLSELNPVLAMKSYQNCPSILPIISKFCHLLDENELDALGDE